MSLVNKMNKIVFGPALVSLTVVNNEYFSASSLILNLVNIFANIAFASVTPLRSIVFV